MSNAPTRALQAGRHLAVWVVFQLTGISLVERDQPSDAST